jgi:hypothetical protein
MKTGGSLHSIASRIKALPIWPDDLKKRNTLVVAVCPPSTCACNFRTRHLISCHRLKFLSYLLVLRCCCEKLQSSPAHTALLLFATTTAGNVRLEEGKPSDVWYASCVDLVNSRFQPNDYDDSLKVSGVESTTGTQACNAYNMHTHTQASITHTQVSYAYHELLLSLYLRGTGDVLCVCLCLCFCPLPVPVPLWCKDSSVTFTV